MDEFIDQRIAAHAAAAASRKSAVVEPQNTPPKLEDWMIKGAQKFDDYLTSVNNVLERSQIEPIIRGIFDYAARHNVYRDREINFYTEVMVTSRATISELVNKVIYNEGLPQPRIEKKYSLPLYGGQVISPAKLTIHTIEEAFQSAYLLVQLSEQKSSYHSPIEMIKTQYIRKSQSSDYYEHAYPPDYWLASVSWTYWGTKGGYLPGDGSRHQGGGSSYYYEAEVEEGFTVFVKPTGMGILGSPTENCEKIRSSPILIGEAGIDNVTLIKQRLTDAYLGQLK